MRHLLLISTRRLFLPFMFAVLLLSVSCGSKKFQRTIETDAFTLKLVGKKATSLDPYEVGLMVNNKKNKREVSLQLEIYAGELNEQNPRFQKKDEHRYSLVFTQSDDTVRELILTVSDEDVVVEEVL